jgi:hypothetical protein
MRCKRSATISVGYGLLAAAACAAPANADRQPAFACPPAFDLGALTAEQRLALPRVQAGLAAGLYTRDDVLIVIQHRADKNGNGLICVQDTPGAAHAAAPSAWPYSYNLVDDNAAARP